MRGWINASFPQLIPALRQLRADLPAELDARTIHPPEGAPPSTLGIAMDYRVRFRLGTTPAEELVAYAGAQQMVEDHLSVHDSENLALWRHSQDLGGLRLAGPVDLSDAEVSYLAPAAFVAALESEVEDLAPVGRTLDDAAEERMDLLCCALALFEEVYRTGGIWGTSPLMELRMSGTADDVLRLIPVSWTHDLANISQRLFREVGDRLMGPALLNPTFVKSAAIGGSDADVILNGCLLEIKTTVNPRLEPDWFRQLLGYVLLDADDACSINSIGVLLSRQAVLLTWPLEEVLAAMIGTRHQSLAELRVDFSQMLERHARG